MEKNKKHTAKEIILFSILVFIIIIVRVRNISELNGPYIFGDEAGYWTHAANMSGLPWTEVEQMWYAYGYSLLLVPLFWITHNMSILYKMAIILNSIMGICGFILGDKIIHEIDEKCNNITSMILSFTATCYSAYVFQSNIAWSETFIYTWFLLIIWSMIKFCKKNTCSNFIILTAEIAFFYIIHNRNIVIYIAYILSLLYMAFKNRISWKKIAAVIFILLFTYIIDLFIREKLSLLIWGHANGFRGNNITSIANMKLFLSLEGWGILIKSLAGKIWYTFTSTIMLGYLGIMYIFQNIFLGIRHKKNTLLYNMSFFYIFLGLFICGSIAVATITMNLREPLAAVPRIDLIFYGRYHETINGILIILGILYTLKITNKNRYLLVSIIGSIVYILCSISVHQQIKNIEKFVVNVPCVPGIYFRKEFYYIQFCEFVIICFILICICRFFLCGKKYRTYATGILGVLLTTVFLNVSQNAYENHTQIFQKSNEMRIHEISRILNANSEYTIYCLGPDDYMQKVDYNKKLVRTRIVDAVVKRQLPNKLEDNFFIVLNVGNNEVILQRTDIYFVEGNKELALFAVGKELQEHLQNAGYSSQKIDKAGTDILTMDDIQIFLPDKKERRTIGMHDNLYIHIGISNGNPAFILNNSNYKLSYHIFDENGKLIKWDNERYQINDFVVESIIPIKIDSDKFEKPGKYFVQIDVVQEGVNWYSDIHSHADMLELIIEVENN